MDSSSLATSWMRVVLIAVFAAIGGVAFVYLPGALLGAISKTAAIFIGTVWVTVMAFALKIADITEAPELSVSEHERLEKKVRSAVRHVWLYAGANAIAAVLVLLPSVMIDGKTPIMPWMSVLAGAALGFSIFSVLAHAWWQEELRRFRSKQKMVERSAKQAEKLAKSMADRGPCEISDKVKQEIATNNTTLDWPVPPVH